MDNLKSIAVKSIFWVGSIRYISQLISWSVTLFLIRLLSPQDYGLMGLALVYMGFVTIFFDLSIGEAILQKKDITEIDINTAFWLCIFFSIALYALTWPLANVWASFFSSPQLVTIIRVIGVNLFFSSIREIPNRLLSREFEFKKRSLFELVSAMLCLMVSFCMAFYGFGVWSLVIGELVRGCSLTVLIIIYLKWVPQLIFSSSSAVQLLKFGIPVTGHYFLNYLCGRSDSIIIGKVLGQEVLGYYTVALSLSRIPIDKGVLIIQQVMFPLFSKLQNDGAEFKKYYYQVVYIISIFFVPVLFGMFVVSEDIIILILSPKWMPSLLSFRIFCIAGIFWIYSGMFVIILKSLGITSSVFRYSLYSTIFMPIGFLIAIPFGLLGVSLTWLIVTPFLFGFLLYSIKTKIGLDMMESFRKVKHAFSGSIVMIIIVFFVKNYLLNSAITYVTFSLNIITGVLAYLGYFFIFSRQTFKDIKNIWNILSNKIEK